MIYIRTDANEVIGTGHMMRCLTIAVELRKHGLRTIFLISDKASSELIEPMGFSYQILETDWQCLHTEKEIRMMRSILKSNSKKPVLLTDSYFVENKYFLQLKDFARLTMIDDLFAETYDVDMLINSTIYVNFFNYDHAYRNKQTRLLLGPKYLPLREQFKNVDHFRFEPQQTKESYVLLMCGGGDPSHVLLDIIEFGYRSGFLNDTVLHVVAGAYHPQIDALKEWEKKTSHIRLHHNISNMAGLMSECDIAVTAAGTTLYELCAIGIPTVFFCMADNQKYDKLSFSRDASMLYAGDIRFQRKQCIENIYTHIGYLKSNTAACRKMSSRISKIVDGKGAERIACELIKL